MKLNKKGSALPIVATIIVITGFLIAMAMLKDSDKQTEINEEVLLNNLREATIGAREHLAVAVQEDWMDANLGTYGNNISSITGLQYKEYGEELSSYLGGRLDGKDGWVVRLNPVNTVSDYSETKIQLDNDTSLDYKYYLDNEEDVFENAIGSLSGVWSDGFRVLIGQVIGTEVTWGAMMSAGGISFEGRTLWPTNFAWMDLSENTEVGTTIDSEINIKLPRYKFQKSEYGSSMGTGTNQMQDISERSGGVFFNGAKSLDTLVSRLNYGGAKNIFINGGVERDNTLINTSSGSINVNYVFDGTNTSVGDILNMSESTKLRASTAYIDDTMMLESLLTESLNSSLQGTSDGIEFEASLNYIKNYNRINNNLFTGDDLDGKIEFFSNSKKSSNAEVNSALFWQDYIKNITDNNINIINIVPIVLKDNLGNVIYDEQGEKIIRPGVVFNSNDSLVIKESGELIELAGYIETNNIVDIVRENPLDDLRNDFISGGNFDSGGIVTEQQLKEINFIMTLDMLGEDGLREYISENYYFWLENAYVSGGQTTESIVFDSSEIATIEMGVIRDLFLGDVIPKKDFIVQDAFNYKEDIEWLEDENSLYYPSSLESSSPNLIPTGFAEIMIVKFPESMPGMGGKFAVVANSELLGDSLYVNILNAGINSDYLDDLYDVGLVLKSKKHDSVTSTIDIRDDEGNVLEKVEYYSSFANPGKRYVIGTNGRIVFDANVNLEEGEQVYVNGTYRTLGEKAYEGANSYTAEGSSKKTIFLSRLSPGVAYLNMTEAPSEITEADALSAALDNTLSHVEFVLGNTTFPGIFTQDNVSRELSNVGNENTRNIDDPFIAINSEVMDELGNDIRDPFLLENGDVDLWLSDISTGDVESVIDFPGLEFEFIKKPESGFNSLYDIGEINTLTTKEYSDQRVDVRLRDWARGKINNVMTQETLGLGENPFYNIAAIARLNSDSIMNTPTNDPYTGKNMGESFSDYLINKTKFGRMEDSAYLKLYVQRYGWDIQPEDTYTMGATANIRTVISGNVKSNIYAKCFPVDENGEEVVGSGKVHVLLDDSKEFPFTRYPLAKILNIPLSGTPVVNTNSVSGGEGTITYSFNKIDSIPNISIQDFAQRYIKGGLDTSIEDIYVDNSRPVSFTDITSDVIYNVGCINKSVTTDKLINVVNKYFGNIAWGSTDSLELDYNLLSYSPFFGKIEYTIVSSIDQGYPKNVENSHKFYATWTLDSGLSLANDDIRLISVKVEKYNAESVEADTTGEPADIGALADTNGEVYSAAVGELYAMITDKSSNGVVHKELKKYLFGDGRSDKKDYAINILNSEGLFNFDVEDNVFNLKVIENKNDYLSSNAEFVTKYGFNLTERRGGIDGFRSLDVDDVLSWGAGIGTNGGITWDFYKKDTANKITHDNWNGAINMFDDIVAEASRSQNESSLNLIVNSDATGVSNNLSLVNNGREYNTLKLNDLLRVATYSGSIYEYKEPGGSLLDEITNPLLDTSDTIMDSTSTGLPASIINGLANREMRFKLFAKIDGTYKLNAVDPAPSFTGSGILITASSTPEPVLMSGADISNTYFTWHGTVITGVGSVLEDTSSSRFKVNLVGDPLLVGPGPLSTAGMGNSNMAKDMWGKVHVVTGDSADDKGTQLIPVTPRLLLRNNN